MKNNLLKSTYWHTQIQFQTWAMSIIIDLIKLAPPMLTPPPPAPTCWPAQSNPLLVAKGKENISFLY